MNLWIKINPNFDNDDALDKFLMDAHGLMLMFDAPARYMFQDIPKFLIYALVMYVQCYGDKSSLPFVVLGKLEQTKNELKSDDNL
jgi:hypothetical protein